MDAPIVDCVVDRRRAVREPAEVFQIDALRRTRPLRIRIDNVAKPTGGIQPIVEAPQPLREITGRWVPSEYQTRSDRAARLPAAIRR